MHTFSIGVLLRWSAVEGPGRDKDCVPTWLSCMSCSNVNSCPSATATAGVPTEYRVYHTKVNVDSHNNTHTYIQILLSMFIISDFTCNIFYTLLIEMTDKYTAFSTENIDTDPSYRLSAVLVNWRTCWSLSAWSKGWDKGHPGSMYSTMSKW